MSDEDQKSAVGFAINLSGQIVTAALAMLAIQFAYIAFALGNRSVGAGFYITSSLSVIFYVISIFLAGRGIATSYSQGANGNWDIAHGDSLFNFQAYSCLLGIALFFISIFFSYQPKQSVIQEKIVTIDNRIEELSEKMSILNYNTEKLNDEFAKISINSEKISLEISNLQKAILELKCEPPKKEK